MGKNNILCFGEVLLRLQGSNGKLLHNKINESKIYTGGSELNVAVKLANLGLNSNFITGLSDNHISNLYRNIIQNHGVNINKFITKPGRLGTYYLFSENGLSTGEVLYDREFTSFSNLDLEDFDWNIIFEDINWLHISAITPGLSKKLANISLRLVEEAHKRNIIISIDLNYRKNLWQYGVDPKEIMPEIVQYASVVMGNIWASAVLLNTAFPVDITRVSSKEEMCERSNKVAQELFNKFQNVNIVANTFRFMDNPNHNLLFGTSHSRQHNCYSETLETVELKDRIGSGDSFMAGVIYGVIKGYTQQEMIEFATLCGFKKLFIEGDF